MFLSGESCALQLLSDHTIWIARNGRYGSKRILSSSKILFTIPLLGKWPCFSYSVIF